MLNIPGFSRPTEIYESANSLVYRAIREADHQSIILKVLKEDYPTPEELARYRREYDIIKSLNSPGVVQVYDLQKYQNTLVMSMEDFGGKSLKIWLEQRPFTLAEFLPIAIATTKILGQIHTANIIHKDINPSNIVFNPENGQIKIIDFGIATQLTQETPVLKDPNILEGTLAYMSPEQTGRMNRPLDYRTDFYSLGMTFYELLTNQLPFSSNDPLELVHCQIAKLPLPPAKLNSEIPQIISEIVMNLIAKNAEDRYQSAVGIQADLEECWHQLQADQSISNFPLGRQDISSKFQIPPKLYGRDREIETLLTAFERVSLQQSELMLITGSSGIGKSKLVQEIYKPITKKRGYFISGKFDQYQRNIPYSALVTAFQELIKQLLTEPEIQLEQWRKKLLAAVGVNGQVIVEVIPEIELIIGQQPALLELDANQSQNLFHLVFQNFIKVFIKPEHPLVLFLDDWQWADGASLKLIELLLMSVMATPGLFLIGTYRDNEVSAAHPLMLTIDKIAKQGVPVNHIYLSLLDLSTVAQLISETIKSDPTKVKDLAELVLFKTGGNPFFINQFLQSLYLENLLKFDLSQSEWQWNLEQIKTCGFTDNVVDLLANKMQKLPKSTQDLLKLAACIGNLFDLKILSLISGKSLAEMVNHLHIAVSDNLIIPSHNERNRELAIILSESNISNEFSGYSLPSNFSQSIEYKFAHDKIHQATYSLIPPSERAIAHYQIGKLILAQISPTAQAEQIFTVVHQLNYGIGLIENQTERDYLAQLNLFAGRKARATSAYQTAYEYAEIGINLLDLQSWERDYEMTLKLHELGTEVASLSGKFEQMEKWFNSVINHAQTSRDKVGVTLVKIQALISQNQLLAAIAIGESMLKELGVEFPEHPTREHIQQVMLEIYDLIKQNQAREDHHQSIEDLFHLQVMVDPQKIAIMQVATRITSVYFIIGSPLFVLVVALQVNLSLQYGNSPTSAISYAAYSGCLINFFQDVKTAIQFNQLAYHLATAPEGKNIRAETFGLIGLFLHHQSHLRETLPIYQAGYQAGLETGNLEFVGHNGQAFCLNSYLCGRNLAELEPEIRAYRQQLFELNQITSANYCSVHWETVLFLLDNPAQIELTFTNQSAEEKLVAQSLLSQDARVFFFYLNSAMLKFILGDIPRAKADIIRARQYLAERSGTTCEVILYFYDSLITLAIVPESKAELELQQQQIEKNQTKLQFWAEQAPMNYLHKWQLVEAEKCRILGDRLAAIDFYDQAIQGAKEHEFIQETAIAYELAAKFYLSQGKELNAKSHLQEAYYCYQLWGAVVKIKDLEHRYPQLLVKTQAKIKDINNPTTLITTTGENSHLDIVTVMKASLAISSEILLDKLLSSLIKIVLENAGAERGYLISLLPGKFHIEVVGSIENNQINVLLSIPTENSDLFSEAIVNYVARTKEIVVLNDATETDKFNHDIYIKTHQPKSILCLPLIHQNKIISIVYLENNLTIGAFTSDRLEVLKLLSGQAAISIENAKLYSEIRENENRLNQFLEGIPIGILIHAPDGKPLYTNRIAQQLLGQGVRADTTIENLAETYEIYLTGTDQLYPSNQIPGISALQGKNTRVDDIELRHSDRIIPIEAWGKPIYDEQGNISYGMGVFQDITDRKKAEAERQRFTNELSQLNQAYQRFVPRQFLQFLQKSSITDVQLGDQVQLEMSILFSDIRDFTTLSEKMTPADNFKFINAYLSRMEPVIIENHGFIDKYIGDAIMALFSGAADHAVKAGIAMLHRLFEYNQSRINSGYIPIQIGIGINTGALMLGTVGGQNRMDGTVISDAVNLGSRVEGLTKNYGVSLLITEQTYTRLSNPHNYAIRTIDTVQVKGKSQLVTVYEVFDADSVEIKVGKLETQSTFIEALSLYNQGELTLAMQLFAACLEHNPGDRVAQIYFQRCQT